MSNSIKVDVSPKMKEIISLSLDKMMEVKAPLVDVSIFMLVMLENVQFSYIHKDLRSYGVKNVPILEQNFRDLVNQLPDYNGNYDLEKNRYYSEEMKELMLSTNKDYEIISPEIVLNKIVLMSKYKNIFEQAGLNINDFIDRNLNLQDYSQNTTSNQKTKKSEDDEDSQSEISDFLTNMNEEYELERSNGQSQPIIGRDNEMREVINILSRKQKNNPILVGKSGVGKTSIVEGLVHRIVLGDVPNNLKNKKIYRMDLASISAGAKYRGELEERVKKIIHFVKESGDVILFIDEIHNLLVSGKTEGSVGVAELMKADLSRAGITCIGTTTLEEYRESFEKDKAMERRFHKIIVNEPSEKEAKSILLGLKKSYEQYHGVKISNYAIDVAVEMSIRYLKDQSLPDKAIDLLDTTTARVKVENDTLPAPLDRLKRKIEQLKLERASIDIEDERSETIEKIERIEKEKTQLEVELDTQMDKLKKERGMIDEKIDIMTEISIMEEEIKRLEKSGDMGELAKIKNGLLPEAYKKLEKIDELMFDEHGNSKFELLKTYVSEDAIAESVGLMTGVPVKKLVEEETVRLLNIEKELQKRVVGQNEAISNIADVVRISKTGLNEENKPIGSFLFLGPTGVGKTEVAKALSEFMFDNENNMIRFDMSEYAEAHSVAKLIGAPPGYVGYDKGGELTNAVKNKPYSIVLFDEVEKAHNKFADILLQVLDDGRLSDSFGNVIDFTNTVIIMTSNIGSMDILDITEKAQNKGVDVDKIEMKKAVDEHLKSTFRPELINRLSDIMIFNPLKRENIDMITEIQLKKLRERIEKHQKMDFIWTNEALNLIADRGFDQKYGARPLKREIANEVQKPLSKEILSKKFVKGDQIILTVENEEFVFNKGETQHIEIEQ